MLLFSDWIKIESNIFIILLIIFTVLLIDIQSKSKQIVGNVGLFYICYELSKRGWNTMPTSRNAKEVYIIIYNQDSTRKYTIQLKSLSKRSPVPLGKSKEIIADYLIKVKNYTSEIKKNSICC